MMHMRHFTMMHMRHFNYNSLQVFVLELMFPQQNHLAEAMPNAKMPSEPAKMGRKIENT